MAATRGSEAVDGCVGSAGEAGGADAVAVSVAVDELDAVALLWKMER